MSRSVAFWACLVMMAAASGCGGEAPPNPATLTAEEEQEILDQVNASANAEQGHSVEQ